jgi:hypothetical protein
MEYQHCINPQKTATANIQPHHKNKYSKLLQIYSYFINIQNNTSFFVFFIKKQKTIKSTPFKTQGISKNNNSFSHN